jgi:hypothetical protein
MELQEKNILIARRVPPSDRWILVDDEKQTIHKSLTETLEAYFQKVQKPYEFRLAPLKGEIYIITTEEIQAPPPKKFNVYGDY